MKRNSENIFINSSKQNILTLSTDEANPMMLIVHGGPGSPDRPLVEKYNYKLADDFTIVCWDQRGSGLSYCKEQLSISMLLNDLNSLVDYLCDKYQQNKIIIAGHSWGAYLGLKYVSLYPNKVFAYVGTGQGISSNDKIDKYSFCLKRAKSLNDTKALKKLKTINISDKKLTKFVHKYGGYIHPNNSFGMSEYINLYIKYYGINSIKVIKGINHSLSCLQQEMLDNENSSIKHIKVPIKIIQGEWDYICPTATIKVWLDELQAPKKEFVIIKNAAHMVNFEQPQMWNEEVKSFLRQIPLC